MPYIEQKDRAELLTFTVEGKLFQFRRRELGEMMGAAMRNGGDLQYILAVAIQTYLEKMGLRYKHCEEIMGALTGANAEFYRCIVAPYEEQKIGENGFVYTSETMKKKGY